MFFARFNTCALGYLLIATLSLVAASAGADTHVSSPKQEHDGLRLYVLDCGQILARDVSLFNPLIPKGMEMTMVDPCYLIQHKQETLLWDAGLSDVLIKSKTGVDVMGRAFHMSVNKTLASQLQAIGIEPASIDYLAFSHLHLDHTGNAKLFKQAVWLMQEAEYQVAYGADAAKYGYHPADYAGIKGVNIQKLVGQHDVFGDGSVVLIPTPGHTPGHQSLLVNLADTGPVLLAGDLYHFQFNREHYGIPVWNDKKATIRSFVMIDELLDKTKAQLWIKHDKSHFDALKKAPAYYH
jgi:N-acyl homoserine lactone hydrolase